MPNIIQGGDLMLFIGDKSIAFATNHTLTVSSETSDVSHKDIKGGTWTAAEIKQLSWEITSENLYSVDGYGHRCGDLFEAMTNRTKLLAVFGVNEGTTDFAPATGWSAPTAGIYSGEVIVSSLEINAPVGDNATFTATFTGTGALTYTPSEDY